MPPSPSRRSNRSPDVVLGQVEVDGAPGGVDRDRIAVAHRPERAPTDDSGETCKMQAPTKREPAIHGDRRPARRLASRLRHASCSALWHWAKSFHVLMIAHRWICACRLRRHIDLQHVRAMAEAAQLKRGRTSAGYAVCGSFGHDEYLPPATDRWALAASKRFVLVVITRLRSSMLPYLIDRECEISGMRYEAGLFVD